MHEKSLKTLEFNKIIEFLSSHALSEETKAYCRELKPSNNFNEVLQNIEETDEAYRLIFKCGNPPISAFKDIKPEIKRLQMGGSLSAEGLLKIAKVLTTSRLMKKYYSDFEDMDENAVFVKLKELFQSLRVYKRLEDRIIESIISEDEIADDASSLLKSIRRNKRLKSESIKQKLEKMINSEFAKKNLQDSIYTIRNGRYVVPVKRDLKSEVPGLVHDMSSSGQTLFIEPMEIVELNNAIKELNIEEEAEIERILMELSSMAAEYSYEIEANAQVLKELDFIFAKGKLAISMKATKPNLNLEGKINLKKARHPLLNVEKIVPTDVYLGDKFKTLVITGPNTGGKTVSLKTVGLLSLMAQAGLFIPADENSEVAVFKNIYADIGDEQSIEQNLSTFSSHMVNIVEILSIAEEGSLALFDELGAGTDPTEGEALAIAVLEELKNRNVTTMVTTHYNQLKVYAVTTENVENASMEFDIETLSPTYRLLIGIPGKSNAFEISKRLGLDEKIIDKARKVVEADNIKFEDMLSQIDKSRVEIEEKLQEINNLKQEAEAEKLYIEREKQKLLDKKEKYLKEAREEASKIIEEATFESKLVIDELKDISKNFTSDSSKRIQEAQDILRERKNKLDASQSKNLLNIKNEKPPEDLKEGDSVEILSLKTTGTVVNQPDQSGNVTVQVGLMKMTLPINSLRLSSRQEEIAEKSAKKFKNTKSKTIKPSIDLRGMNVEEAIFELDKYLDDAYLSGLKKVEVIHGKGTGALREGLIPYFRKHKMIEKFRLGEYNEGGSGVTILELK